MSMTSVIVMLTCCMEADVRVRHLPQVLPTAVSAKHCLLHRLGRSIREHLSGKHGLSSVGGCSKAAAETQPDCATLVGLLT